MINYVSEYLVHCTRFSVEDPIGIDFTFCVYYFFLYISNRLSRIRVIACNRVFFHFMACITGAPRL